MYHLLSVRCFVYLRNLHSFPTRRSSDLGVAWEAISNRYLRYLGVLSGEQHRWPFLYMERERRRRTRAPLALLYDRDRKSTRLNSSHLVISYAVFCLKKKTAKSHQRLSSG